MARYCSVVTPPFPAAGTAGLLATGLLTFAFLAGQVLAWRELAASGQYASGNPANAFFYLLTAFHALHLLGGLAALGRGVIRVYGDVELERVRLGAELCAVYWHYLLVVWLVLFGFMLST